MTYALDALNDPQITKWFQCEIPRVVQAVSASKEIKELMAPVAPEVVTGAVFNEGLKVFTIAVSCISSFSYLRHCCEGTDFGYDMRVVLDSGNKQVAYSINSDRRFQQLYLEGLQAE